MREFPQTSVEFNFNPLFWLVPVFALILVSLAVMQWRRKRKAAVIDAALWIGAALFILLVSIAQLDHREVWEALEPLWPVLLLIAIVGCAVSWVRLLQQEQPRQLGLSILMTILIVVFAVPALQPARETGGSPPPYRYCMHNLHQIGLGLYTYNETHSVWPSPQAGEPPHSWRVAVLPYVDGHYIYDQYDFSAAWDSDINRPLANGLFRLYWCPSMEAPERDEPMTTAFALIVGDDAAWSSSGVIDHADIPDGASNTAIVAEACGLNIIWTEPRDIDLATTPIGINLPGDAPGHSPGILSTYHAKGANVLMADGSVRGFAIETDPKVLEAITTADGGEDVGEF